MKGRLAVASASVFFSAINQEVSRRSDYVGFYHFSHPPRISSPPPTVSSSTLRITAANNNIIISAAFSFLEDQTKLHGDELPRDLLLKGFLFDTHRVPLLGPQGIFKPAIMELPLSIFTAPLDPAKQRPYNDRFDDQDRVLYCYRGKDPLHRDNVGVRSF
ncbi:MAG: hypothetical protein NTY77_16045 [Elusimicrobia bacterium]|nr:hypothetical protein [Elusimicrobiota bacterium]